MRNSLLDTHLAHRWGLEAEESIKDVEKECQDGTISNAKVENSANSEFPLPDTSHLLRKGNQGIIKEES